MKKLLAILLNIALLAPGIASAARLDTIGNETNWTSATYTYEYTLNGIFSAAFDGATSTKAHGGTYSLHFNEPATNFSWMAYKYRAAASAASTTVRTYIFINQLFATSTELFTLANEGPGSLYSLRLNTSDQICLFDAAPSQVGSCTAITSGTWHYIELATNGAGTAIGRLDGVTFASGAAVTGGAISRVYFGCAFSAGCKQDIYYDDAAINDGTGSAQTFFPGAGTVIRLSPTAAGDANLWLLGAGGTAGWQNNFGRVNEVTPDGATTFNMGTTTTQEDLYNITDSGIGASDTVSVVTYHVVFKENNLGGATFKVEAEKTSGGTISQGAAIAPSSAATYVANAAADPRNPSLVLYNDPDGAAWTKTTLDSMQIGYKVTTGAANRDEITSVWAYVDYVPSAVVVSFTLPLPRMVLNLGKYLFMQGKTLIL